MKTNLQLIQEVEALRDEADKREQEFGQNSRTPNSTAWHRAQAAKVAYDNVLQILRSAGNA